MVSLSGAGHVETIDTDKTIGEGDYRWRRSASPASFDSFGALDFVRIYGHSTRSAVIAATRFVVKKSNTYTLTVSADDALYLLCDGRRLLSREASGPLTDRFDRHTVQLEEGIHLLVARVSQRGGAWQFLARFSDEDGNPTDDIAGLTELK